MELRICSNEGHVLQTAGYVIYPETLGVTRRDTCYEIEKVGGGIELRTNGSRGLELVAEGRYSPTEKRVLQALIESFVSDGQTVAADQRNYGKMILLEGILTEKRCEPGGSYRLKFGGYELENDDAEEQ